MSAAPLELKVEFPGSPDYLHLATGAARLFCGAVREPALPKDFTDEVELVVSEACTNAIRHAARGASDTVAVRFRAAASELIIEVVDHGAGFDIEDVPPPDFQEHPEGGYGLYIIRKMMDEVRYIRIENSNTLTMKKYFKRTSPPE